MSAAAKPAQGDAVARRRIAEWRRTTAQLQVLVNIGAGTGTLASEAYALSRQCLRMAEALQSVATRRAAAAPGMRAAPKGRPPATHPPATKPAP